MNQEPEGKDAPPTRELARDAAWTVLGLVAIGTMRVVARLTAEQWFGLTGLAFVTAALSAATLATIPGSGGLTAGITKLLSETLSRGETERAQAFTVVVVRITLLLSAVAALGVAWWAGSSSALTGGGPVLVVSTALLTLSFGAYLAGKAVAYGSGRVRTYALSETAGVALFLLTLAAVIWKGERNYVLLPLVAAYLPVALLARPMRRIPPVEEQLPMKALAGYATVGVVGTLAGIGFTQMTPLAASLVGGIRATALFGAALTLLEPLNLLPRTVGLVLLPKLSSMSATGASERAAATLSNATRIVALVALPACGLIVLERDRVLQWIFSESLVGGSTLAWLAAAFGVSLIGSPSVTSLAAIRARDASISMWSALFGLGVAVMVWASAGSSYGTVAIAVGFAAGSLLKVFFPIVAATRRYGPHWGSFWWRTAAVAAIVGLLAGRSAGIANDAVLLAAVAILMGPDLALLAPLVRAIRV